MQTSRPSRVFLMGMMGSGKTAVGTALARKLGWHYRDNDQQLQVTVGASVDAVADAVGRERLHQLEVEQALLAAGEPPPLVASLASSVVEHTQLWPVLRAAGWCVYLRASAETLVARVGAGEGRPWLAVNQSEFIERTLTERDPLYLDLADEVVEVDVLDSEQVADSILAKLTKLGADGSPAIGGVTRRRPRRRHP